jgi:gliding motility-associated-like protein
MANNDATLDGYDRTRVDSFVCRTNPFFYHLISRNAGNADADIRIFYNLAADSLWDGMAHWELPTPAGEWRDLSPVTHTPATPLSSVTKAAWPQFDPQPFILSRIRPGVPQILGNDTVCGNKTQLYTGLPDNDTWVYNWSINNGNVTSTPADNEAIVNWNAAGGPGSVTLTVTAQNGCESFPQVLNVLVNPEVVAAFNFSPNGGMGSQPVVFADQSQNANQWDWTFGGSGTSTLQNPTHIFNTPDTYEITLIATSPEGCKDTAMASLTIIEGINIPNIFTPNGDGVNDLFEITLSGFENFRCSIFNRWGNLMFETDAPQISWDGRTAAGKLVPDCTYFVVIEFMTPNGPYTHKGTVNVHY